MPTGSSLYQRVLLKLSGEALMGEHPFGLSSKVLSQVASEIKAVLALGVQVGVVIGGGNFLRGGTLAESGMNRVAGDHMGMLATVMNSIALQDALRQQEVDVVLMSSREISGVCEAFQYDKAIEVLNSGSVAIFAGGTGNPFFTTDTAACLRGIEINADVVVKATKVDGVYDKDPAKYADALRYDTLTYDEILEKKLAVMDLTAIMLCQEHQMPLRVIDMTTDGNLQAMVQSDKIGTLVGG